MTSCSEECLAIVSFVNIFVIIACIGLCLWCAICGRCYQSLSHSQEVIVTNPVQEVAVVVAPVMPEEDPQPVV